MKNANSLKVWGALGLMSVALSPSAWAVDTTQWKCESCPYDPPGASGRLDLGVTVVSDRSAKFADFTGLDRRGGRALIGGTWLWRGSEGGFASVEAANLALDSRSVQLTLGQEGLGGLRLGFDGIPRYLGEGVLTPYSGVGSTALTLPAGFAAADTASMPLAAALSAVDVGVTRRQFDLSATIQAGERWSYRITTRHDTKDGTSKTFGSFYNTAVQLVMPVNQVTDQVEVAGSYAGQDMQFSVAYLGSMFRNSADTLTWQNPFTPVVAGATTGRLALAPDNEFHQAIVSMAYTMSPKLRWSADVASGKMIQDASFVATTTNVGLTVGSLPATSLGGHVNTLNANLRATASPVDFLRLTAVATHDERDNETPSRLYPAVATDMWLGASSYNQPYSYRQDKVKFSGDARLGGRWSAQLGLENDEISRTLQEVATTRELKAWARVQGPISDLGTGSVKLARGSRVGSNYNALTSVYPINNPLLRKFNLADRLRDTLSARADMALTETINVGLSADASADDYHQSPIGLKRGESLNLTGDLSVAVAEGTSVHGFVSEERLRSQQAGSANFATVDWTARMRDVIDMAGLGLRYQAMGGKLNLSADMIVSRSRSTIFMQPGAASDAFPAASVAHDTLKMQASYRLQENLTLVGNLWYQHYAARDWHQDGLLAGTVSNLLSLGQQPARYDVKALTAYMRYRF